jgi:uncharacterized protein with HEPN domain
MRKRDYRNYLSDILESIDEIKMLCQSAEKGKYGLVI